MSVGSGQQGATTVPGSRRADEREAPQPRSPASGGVPAGPRSRAGHRQAIGAGGRGGARDLRDRQGRHQQRPGAAVRLVRRVRADAVRQHPRHQARQAAPLPGPDRGRRPADSRRHPLLEQRRAGDRRHGGGRLRRPVRRRAEPDRRARQHLPAAGVRAAGERAGTARRDPGPPRRVGAGGGRGPAGRPAGLGPALVRHPPRRPGHGGGAAGRPRAGARGGPSRPAGPRRRRKRAARAEEGLGGHAVSAHRARPQPRSPWPRC